MSELYKRLATKTTISSRIIFEVLVKHNLIPKCVPFKLLGW